MKKRLFSIISLILIGSLVYQNGGLGFLNSKTAYAVGDLDVVWQSDPLFNYSNIAPGFEVARTVVVTNNASSPRSIGVKGLLATDSGNMKTVMRVEIKEGSSVLYENSLEQFLIDSGSPNGISLSSINPGDNKSYDFTVTFNESAGNEFQDKNIVFDLSIGIVNDLPQECSLINLNGKIIYGTSGNDRIQGTSKNDLIVTYEGNDKVEAGGGHDCIVAGEGKDYVDDQTGNDVIDLGEGDDVNSPSGGKDIIFGRGGNDVIDAGSDDDYVDAGIGNDKVDGGSGKDLIFGRTGNDKLAGGSGDDTANGEEGNDEMDGGSGKDLLDGGPGTDKAYGGSGTDTCIAETKTGCEL